MTTTAARGARLRELRIVKPVVRAYSLAFLASVGPRLVGFIRVLRDRNLTVSAKFELLLTILKTAIQLRRFPTAAALIVGGATTIPDVVIGILRRLLQSLRRDTSRLADSGFVRRLRFTLTFASAFLAFSLLNKDVGWVRKRARSRGATESEFSQLDYPNQHHLPPPNYRPQYAGKTIDFTLFALLRAADVAAITAWTSTRSRSWHPEHRHPRAAALLKKMTDPWIFATSASIIMWSWFYAPMRLPKAYNQWISRAANLDPRLLKALRLCRQGDFLYGQDTGQAPMLKSLCNELGLPDQWGDPVKTIPIPCELYHCGTGPSCEVHAITRLLNSWKFSMSLYLPLQLLTKLRRPSEQALIAAIRDAAQSSSFLASFVAIFYYSVCLARTRLGPKTFSSTTVTPQMWDSGLCVLAGCLTCGWSIMLEKASRRQEIAFFAAPRALATLLPRVYDRRYIRREQVVFALSVAVVLDAVKSRSQGTVRGVLGKVLDRVMQ